MGDNQAAAKSAGSVNVGGRSFNLPEQVAVLLQQAFELMSDSKGAKQQGDEGACAEPRGERSGYHRLRVTRCPSRSR
jgi:hypothetical protein